MSGVLHIIGRSGHDFLLHIIRECIEDVIHFITRQMEGIVSQDSIDLFSMGLDELLDNLRHGSLDLIVTVKGVIQGLDIIGRACVQIVQKNLLGHLTVGYHRVNESPHQIF